jgi:dolichyl-phosphate beta-glucosyltransferase
MELDETTHKNVVNLAKGPEGIPSIYTPPRLLTAESIAWKARRRAIVDEMLHREALAEKPWLSIVLPAYNEERRILPTLLSIGRYLENRRIPAEVLVIDNGSDDGTAHVVEATALHYSEIRLIRQGRRGGKGAAVRTGVLSSKGTWVLFADADGSTPIEEVERLLYEGARGADVAIGSRALKAPDVRVEWPLGRQLMGRLFAALVRWFAMPRIADTQCGFKLFRREVADWIFSRQVLERFGFDVEVLFLARHYNCEISEVPVNWTNVDGSKVGWLSGLDAFFDIFRVRWIHRNMDR